MLAHRAQSQAGGTVPGTVSPPLTSAVSSAYSCDSNVYSPYCADQAENIPEHRDHGCSFSNPVQGQGRSQGGCHDINNYAIYAESTQEDSILASTQTKAERDLGDCCICEVTGVDIAGKGHCVQVQARTTSLVMSGLQLRSVDLSHLKGSCTENMEDVSFAANHLSVFCFKWLVGCASLERISLNGNSLKRLDWGALSNFASLERLWLHQNQLEKVDLQPLASCKALKSLYLDSNCLKESVDLAPLKSCSQLRSLRIGGNALGGRLDVTPLLSLASLRVFDVDSGVTLFSTESLSSVRAPVLKKRAHKIIIVFKCPGGVYPPGYGTCEAKSMSPKADDTSKRKRTKNISLRPPEIEPLDLSGVDSSLQSVLISRSPPPSGRSEYTFGQPATKPVMSVAPVRTLLIGFRRLARYAVEDSLGHVGKVLMRVVDSNIALVDPSAIYDSHLILLHNPSDKLVEQVSRVARSIPIAIIGSERYRTKGYDSMLSPEKVPEYFCDPVQPEDAERIVSLGRQYLIQMERNKGQDELRPARFFDEHSFKFTACGGEAGLFADLTPVEKHRSRSPVVVMPKSAPATMHRRCTFGDLLEKVSNLRRKRKSWGASTQYRQREKLEAERAALEVAFQDLGGYGTRDTFVSIARTCGLPKCASEALFEASVAASNLVEATTPETGVPSCGVREEQSDYDACKPGQRVGCIHVQGFLAYWNKIKDLDSDERLSEVLRDSSAEKNAPCVRFGSSDRQSSGSKSPGSARKQPCVCLKKLVRRFMEGRKHHLGTFSLVKIEESVIIATHLLSLALQLGPMRTSSEVRERDLKRARLSASLIAAEAGRFEGLARALSIDKIRSIKRKFAAESSQYRTRSRNGSTVGYTINERELVNFCQREKTLTPRGVRAVLDLYCSGRQEMCLGQFAQFYASLTELSQPWAASYFFSVMDVDMNGFISVEDVKHFHMEKNARQTVNTLGTSPSLQDIWCAFCDLAQPAAGPSKGISRREFLEHTAEERELMVKTVLFIDVESLNAVA